MKSTGYGAPVWRVAAATMAGLLIGVAPGFAAHDPPREALAQGAGAPTGPPAVSPLSPAAPPEIIKPGVAAKDADDPEAIFKKLDVGQRGYLTPAETKDLLGFDESFKAADQGSGRLTLAQFKKAWALYRSKK